MDFLEWVRLNHAADVTRVLTLLPDLEADLKTARRRAWNRPKSALETYRRIAAELARATPVVLPAFYEHAARAFLSTRHQTYAAQMLAAARQAEAEHGLEVDHDHVDDVFLEFAVADALPAKAVAEYARELSDRLPPDEAFRRFARLCVRRTEAGTAPSAQMAGAVRRLARAAGDQAAREQAYLAEMLTRPAVIRAPAGWWNAHRPALVKLARRDPTVRGALLNLTPRWHPDMNGDQIRALLIEWTALLEESGATAGLGDGAEVSDVERPSDGTAGWLDRTLAAWGTGWGADPRLPGLHALVERVAGRLRAELAAAGRAVAMAQALAHDVDLLDLLLALDVPVADPRDDTRLELSRWARGDARRDLLALAADPRFTAAFRRTADGFYDDDRDLHAVRTLAASPGGRRMLTAWARDLTRRSRSGSLPGMTAAQRVLRWLPPDVLALVAGDVAEAAAADFAPELARTLRAGLFEELCWPAFDEAVAATSTPERARPVMVDAWPYLIVASTSEAWVIGAEGRVLRHPLRLPAENERWGSPGFHFVDGALLVFWKDRTGGLVGYWHSADDAREGDPEPRPLEGDSDEWSRRSGTVTLPLPGGGRTTGGGTLFPGGTAVPDEKQVISDGKAFWVLDGAKWLSYDPVTGARKDSDLPAFLADQSDGGVLQAKNSWLRPAPSSEPTPLGVPVDGLLGWRVTELPDGSLRAEDLAGRRVTMRPTVSDVNIGRHPFGALALPGDDRLRILVQGVVEGEGVRLVDPDGTVTLTSRMPGVDGPVLPPTAHWHQLRPRDPEGSAALREIDHETASALLKAAMTGDRAGDRAGDEDLAATVRALVPRIGDDTLAAGVARIARFTAERQAAVGGVAERLGADRPADELGDPRTDPTDDLLGSALSGLYLSEYTTWGGFLGISGVVLALPQLRALHQALRDGRTAGSAGARLHIGEPGLRSSSVRWGRLLGACAAVALRAAAATTPAKEQEALRRLLTMVSHLGLDSARAGRWRRFELHLDADTMAAACGDSWNDWDDRLRGVLPLDGGAFLAVLEPKNPARGPRRHEYGCDFVALFHDPAGRFEVPAPYIVKASEPLGADREPGWLRAFLAAWSEHGQLPWRESAADEFAELTGVSSTLARLVVAGLPAEGFRDLLKVKAADVEVAREDLGLIAPRGIPAEVVSALLPADPVRLWTEGPDVAAAAAVWNARVGRRTPVPEALVTEGARAMPHVYWGFGEQALAPVAALRAALDPTGAPELTRDLSWTVKDGKAVCADRDQTGFTGGVLVGTAAMAGWLAHRLAAGDPLRAALPTALGLVRDRLAAPGMLIGLGPNVHAGAFRKAAGPPAETGEGWERYGAVIIRDLPWDEHSQIVARPLLRTDLLDAGGTDPHLSLLREIEEKLARPLPIGEAVRRAFSPVFAALIAEPGDPAAGERGKDGTWWPQDPTRSVPALVADVAAARGLSEDAAGVYLMLLAMPDPTDRNTARWTGWKPARLKAARAELAATDLVVQGRRTRAGRSLFLPGGWEALKSPHLPLESWKVPLFGLTAGFKGLESPLGVIVPAEPADGLYRRAWQRVLDGDAPG
ncbi:DNA-binding protein [Actinomadura sp. B10D3]|uniref:DNA-binding protein n=1 Tax=Actinomadura sp. B10D3 TaxID=3153557 RepID=UPI00325C8846